jgi:hypothetical protein
MVDDLEDGDDRIEYQTSDRDGYWYTYDDGYAGGEWVSDDLVPGATAQVPGGCNGSSYCVYAYATGWDGVSGAGVGVDLNNDAGADKQPYDASAYDGVVFWAKGATAPGPLRFRALISDVVPTADGGNCNEDTGDCYDAHATILELTTEWQQFWVFFCELAQSGWGDPQVDMDASAILSLQWQVNAGSDFSMEVWIDDLAFFAVD